MRFHVRRSDVNDVSSTSPGTYTLASELGDVHRLYVVVKILAPPRRDNGQGLPVTQCASFQPYILHHQGEYK